MARFKIIAGGQSRLYDILDDTLTLGTAASNAVRLQQEGVAEVHAKVWRAADGLWVSPVDGASLRVNGETATRHRLRHGDLVELVDGLTLEFVDAAGARPASGKVTPAPTRAPRPAASHAAPAAEDRFKPAPAAAPEAAAPTPPVSRAKLVVPSAAREARDRSAARTQREEAGRRGRPAPPGPRWHLVSGVVLLSVAVVWIGIRVLSDSLVAESAEDLMALAETQLERGNAQLALQTAQAAASRGTGGDAMRAKIAAFETKAKQAMQAAGDAPVLDSARQGMDNLRTFEKSFLAATPTARPACRELVRMADGWRQRYAATCERYPDSAPMVKEAATLRARYAPAAQLDQADDIEDVMFAAKRATRLQRPRYRDAVAAIDAFLARGGDPAVLERARDFRAKMLESGREWFDQKMAQMKHAFELGKTDTVLREVDGLAAESVIDEWKPVFEAAVQRWKQPAGR